MNTSGSDVFISILQSLYAYFVVVLVTVIMWSVLAYWYVDVNQAACMAHAAKLASTQSVTSRSFGAACWFSNLWLCIDYAKPIKWLERCQETLQQRDVYVMQRESICNLCVPRGLAPRRCWFVCKTILEKFKNCRVLVVKHPLCTRRQCNVEMLAVWIIEMLHWCQ